MYIELPRFARLVLAYAVALPLIVGLLAGAVGDSRTYAISVTMESSVPGHVQVFFDSGAGFREIQSSNAWFDTAAGAHEYRLRLPAGRYRTFRIDPGTLPGRYALERVVVLAPDQSIHAEIPLTALEPAYQITFVEKSERRLVVTTPPGTSDPQLLFFASRTHRHSESCVHVSQSVDGALVGWSGCPPWRTSRFSVGSSDVLDRGSIVR